ncbi:MAG TPA: DUF3500 domain-containing protein [Acidimicrobiales bacterium]|nr:DUF3500 domain-containing protein [Acidimicrobiales bacterium]
MTDAHRMAEAAEAWLASLDESQRRLGAWPFSAADERERWFYTPTDHGGLALREMQPAQQQAAMRLLSTGLSPAGYGTASTIMGLDNVLDLVDGWRPPRFQGRERNRDPGLYWFRVFGDPSRVDGAWGWRCGGHHLSVNVTLADGTVISTSPTFFGADPASFPLLGGRHLRPLAAFEDLARELLQSLDPDERNAATLTPAPPSDIVTANRPRVTPGDVPLALAEVFRDVFTGDAAETFEAAQRGVDQQIGWRPEMAREIAITAEPRGVRAAVMGAASRARLRALLLAYVERLPPALAEAAAEAVDRGLDGFGFSWAGSGEPGRPHYYRVQGDDTLVEYDNTQRSANHVHAVWRDLDADFGRGPLARHYEASHGAAPLAPK